MRDSRDGMGLIVRIFPLVVLSAAMVAGCSHGRLKLGAGQEGEIVESEGWAPSDSKDPIATRQRSLIEAQKKAVEKVVGVFISAKTRVDQAITVDQKILANVGGYIRKYDVLSERDEGGFYKTRIRALVLYKKVGEDLRGAGLVRPDVPLGNPKVAVLILGGNGESSSPTWGPSASAAVRRSLLQRGFAVVDLNDKMEESATKSTDTMTMSATGRRLQADLIVTGSAQARPVRDARLGDFKSYRARIELRVVKPSTGEVVSEKSQEASAIDPAAEIAAAKALENAGEMAGSALATELLAGLKNRVNIVVRVEGLKGLDRVLELAEEVRATPGILSVSFSGYSEGSAELLATVEDMTADDLAANLLRMKRFRFRPRGVTPYEVELEGY